MPRLPRIDVVGVPQHIVVRGVDRQPCFFADADRRLYIQIVADAARRSNVAIHAFVLMTNHVHLLSTGRVPGALSAMMHRVGLRYVRRVNTRYGRTGTLFEGRFRASLVQSERHLLACMRYIELNPVRARMVDRPEDYPWSSFRRNAGIACADWLSPHEEYLHLGTSADARAKAWRDLVTTGSSDAELSNIRNHVNRNCALGDSRFQKSIAELLGRRVHIVPRGRHALEMPKHRRRRIVTNG